MRKRTRRHEPPAVSTEERKQSQWGWMEQFLSDWKLTLRRLAKAPGFTITVLLTLAIGIGANTAVFSVVDNVVLRPLPYPDSDRLVALRLEAPGAGGLASFKSGLPLSASMHLTFSEHNRTFISMGVWIPNTANVTGLAEPEEVHIFKVSDGLLETFAVPPVAGRWFNDGDQDPRGAKSVMLGYGYWQRRFGGDPSVIGRILEVDAEPRTIVGVMPRGFRVADRPFDLLVPLAFDRTNQNLIGFGFTGIARLKPGVTITMANADLTRLIGVWMDYWRIAPGVDSHYWFDRWRITPVLEPLKRNIIGNVTSVLWAVMATIGLVLLMACTNLANLLLIRAESRQLELAVRAALGAGRLRIARELLMESVTLALAGGALAGGVACAGLRFLAGLGPTNLPRLAEISLDRWSLAFTLALALVSGILLGTIPAFKYALTRCELAGLNGRTASATRERHRTRNVLVVAQVAMSLVLLVSAVLMIRTFVHMRSVDPGFADAAHIQTVQIVIPELLIHDPKLVLRTENEIVNKLAALPGVSGAGFVDFAPMEEDVPNWAPPQMEGKNYDHADPPIRLFQNASPGYFHTMGTRILAGRDFTWEDQHASRVVTIVSESVARQEWGSPAAAVGKHLRLFGVHPWREIVGVVEDMRQNGVDHEAPATVYWGPFFEVCYIPNPVTLDALRSETFTIHSRRAGTEGLLREVQRAVWSVNASLPVASPRTMGEIYHASMARTSFTLVMLAIAGTMALLLGIVGIYGVIAYAVAQRRREVGIRLALGAQRGELQWMFVRSALLLSGGGVVVGVVAAAGLTRLIRSLLFGVSPIDPPTYLAVVLLMLGASMLTSYLPARKAATVDPVEALRAQ